jgi:hypothetical protein
MHHDALQARLSQRLGAIRQVLARRRWAVVELHVGTPINFTSSDPIDLAGHFREDSRLAARRAAAIEALLAAGWTMDRPTVRLDEPERLLKDLHRAHCHRRSEHRGVARVHCDGFLDFDIRFRKRFRAAELAEQDVRELALHDGSDNWDLGWNERRDGDVTWWCAVVDLTD